MGGDGGVVGGRYGLGRFKDPGVGACNDALEEDGDRISWWELTDELEGACCDGIGRCGNGAGL